jgi:pimeloyl-ACP methyl ester carboxylesterase
VRWLVRTFSILLAILASALLVFLLTGAPTWSGTAYAVGLLAATLGGALLGRRGARPLAAGGVALVLVMLLARLSSGARGTTLVMRTPASTGSRLINRAVDEADLAVSGARLLGLTSFAKDPDVGVLPREMALAYARMRGEQGDSPSPVIATYLGLESPAAYDVIEIGDVEHASATLVFLHGFAGSFSLPCWEVSRAAARVGMATVCPATRWVGDWWAADGTATLRDVVTNLHARGQRHLVLAGLSNGGIGGSLFVARFPDVFDGFIAISGASPEARPPGIPVLCIQGRKDRNIPASIVEAYARHSGGRYVELEAGHFALLVEEERAVTAMADWLRTLPR